MWMTVYDDDLIAERYEYLGKRRAHPSNVLILDGSDVPFEHQIFNQDLVPISLFSTPEGWLGLY